MPFAIERGNIPDVRWTTAEKRTALATGHDCARLGVPPGHHVVRVVRVRSTRGRNDLVAATVVRAGTSAGLVTSGSAEERASIVEAPQWVSDLLDIPASSPVLKLDRVVRTASGHPLEWRLTFSLSSASGGGRGLTRKLRAHNR